MNRRHFHCKRAFSVLGLSGLLLAGPVWAEGEASATDESAQAPPVSQQVASPGLSVGGESVRVDDRVTRSVRSGDVFEGYDFGQVVERVESSVDPLQREMDTGFRAFTRDVQEATELLEAGQTKEAIRLSRSAIEDLLDIREGVTEPMWEGQRYLTDQIGDVRQRLARAVAADDVDDAQLDERTEARLDDIAARIDQESDDLRRQRLVAHYRTVRNLAQIRQLADRMSPNQRKLWSSVLRVLNEATTAHQQVLMGSEVLFAQLEMTAANLDEYLVLMDTVDGASDLLGAVHGLGEQTSGLAEFAQNMHQLQEGLGGFSAAVEGALETSMYELEAQIDAVEPYEGGGLDDTSVMSTRIDDELSQRIQRVRGDD